MIANCTLAGGPGSRLQSPVELTVDAPAGTEGRAIHDQLARKFGVGAVTVDGQDLCSLVLGVPPLVEAAVLVDSVTQPSNRTLRRRPVAEAAPPLALAVDSGAAAGTVVPLRRGSYSIGRSGTRIAIPDPELSREHARVVVTDREIILIDLDSANGTYVDGERIRSTVISTDSSIRCGQSTMSLVFADVPARALADAGKSVAEPIAVSGRVDTGNRGVLFLTAVLPLAVGVLLAVLTGMWMFLAFSAVSASSLLVPVVNGRRQRRELSAAVNAAVEEDRKRRRRCAPPLPLVALAAQRAKGTSPPESAGVSIWLRLGQAEQEANVRVEPAGTALAIPPAGLVPVLLDPGRPLTTLAGPQTAIDGAIRSFLMQLAGYPLAAKTHVLVHGQSGSLPLAARYLPRVTLTATTHAALNMVNSNPPQDGGRGVLLIVGGTSAIAPEHPVLDAAVQRGWQVLQFLPGEGERAGADVFLSERESVLVQNVQKTAFVPDLAPEEVFSGFCRRMAHSMPRGKNQAGSVPATCSLHDVLPLTPAATAERWDSSGKREGLAAPLGLGAAGTKTLDLQSDGPHLLVAGTTGSGKSELLRSLTLALALSYPPERVNFFFIDFKGGSGLGPLSDLVHCVGLQTDLSASEMERTLASLRAEVRLRERCLSAARVPDVSTYRTSDAARAFTLPHLVIVIDEFRMLVDDAPEVLRELLRIASIGRSLGIHLVMATQRPQGALTADIRANVTTSIALRVQSDMESVDIINSRAAAAINVDSPGRAFLARGMEVAEEFQAASLAFGLEATQPGRARVQRTLDYLACQTTRAGNDAAPPPTPAQAVEPMAAMVRRLCAAQGKQHPRRPFAPPLPDKLEDPALGPTPGSGIRDSPCLEPAEVANGAVRLGLMDVPERQQVEALVFHPANQGHAAFIGSPRSGAGAALGLAVHKLMATPGETHFYILDAPGDFLPLAGAGRTGSHVGLHDLRRAVRVLERLVGELGRRLGSPASPHVPLVVTIAGWGSWVSAFRSGPLAWAEDLVQDLVRDGTKAGITLLVSGERELLTARFFGTLPNRFYFPADSTEEGRALWPRLPSTPSVEGRAVAFGPVAGGGPAVCQFYRSPSPHRYGAISPGYPSPSTPPFRVEPLPSKITVKEITVLAGSPPPQAASVQSPPVQEPEAGRQSRLRETAGRRRDVLLGVAGDEAAAASFRLPASGVIAVLGNAGSGKSNALQAMEALNPGLPWHTCPVRREAAGDYWKDVLVQAEGSAVPRETVLLVDDVDLLAPSAVRHLDQLSALGHCLVLTAGYSPMLLQRIPLIMNARASGVGLLLGPHSVADGDLFGIRFEVEAAPPPGRAVLISGGRASPLQIAWAGERG